MNQQLIEANLAAVEAHFHSEAANEVEKALDLFTEDVIWESPVRSLIFHGKEAAGENYRKMFSSMQVKEFRNLERFATEDRVVDDSIATMVLTGDGMANAPVPVGSEVEIRLLHIFEMREGKIARELVFENWRVIKPAINQLPQEAGISLNSPHAYRLSM
jgi:ketosteroid isomerase-like protein